MGWQISVPWGPAPCCLCRWAEHRAVPLTLPAERQGDAHAMPRSAPGQARPGRGQLSTRRWGPHFSTGGCVCWPRLGEALGLVRVGPVPEWVWRCRGLRRCPCTRVWDPNSHSSTQKGQGPLCLWLRPPSQQHPRQLPVTPA